MSEETPTPKKAARKSSQRKSATKSAAPRKGKESEPESNGPEQLAEIVSTSQDLDPPKAQTEEPPSKILREPKEGVRDARSKDRSEEVIEISEPLMVANDDERREGRVENSGNRDGKRSHGDQDDRRGRKRARGRGQGSGENQGQSYQQGQNQGQGAGKPQGQTQGRDQGTGENRREKVRVEVDHEEMAHKAWKIYLSEVTEEGLVLLDDLRLREYARGSFQAARLFLEEKGRLQSSQGNAPRGGRLRADDEQDD